MIASFCLLATGLWPATSTGGEVESPNRVVPRAKLLEDVDVLECVYNRAHPGLYRYHTATEMTGYFQDIRGKFARDRTLAEAYIAISQLLAQVRCGHTYANFFNQPKEVAEALFGGKNRVPFCFRWIDGRMIVTRGLSPENRLQPGTEILAINGVRSKDMLTKLMTIARADGANDGKRIAYLEVLGTGKYEAFDIFLPLFFPSIGNRMDLLARLPGTAEPIAITVAAQERKERQALAKQNGEPQRGESDPLWHFDQLDARTAYLRMPTWALYNSNWDWRSFLDRGIDNLIDRRVPALIVDLRGNEGGLFDVGKAIIARIAATDVRSNPYRNYTRYRTLPLPKAYDAYLDTWDWTFKDWGKAAKEPLDGFFRMTRFDSEENGGVIVRRGKHYQGRVLVLINAVNSSATFQFAQMVKENKLATLVGQTTGGNQRGINGSAFFFVTLPNSRIEVDLPLVGQFVGDERPTGAVIPFRSIPDAGIDPDVAVTPSISDIAQGIDAELLAARRVIEREDQRRRRSLYSIEETRNSLDQLFFLAETPRQGLEP